MNRPAFQLLAMLFLGWLGSLVFGWADALLARPLGLALTAVALVVELAAGALVLVALLCAAWFVLRRSGWIKRDKA